MPGTESWAEKYGPIGVVAGLAIAALVWLITRVVLRGWDAERNRKEAALAAREKADEADRASKEAALAAREKAVEALNAQIVAHLQTTHSETLRLLAEQRAEYEERYQELLDRLLAEQTAARDQLHDVTTRVARAIESLSKKARIEED